MELTFKTDKEGRLDLIVCEKTDFTRSHVKQLVDRDCVLINGILPKKSGQTLKIGDTVSITVPDAVEKIEKKDIPVTILYEDKDIAVINKPQGLTVHPARGNYTDTLVNALMFHLDSLSGINGEIRPGIVHRLDKDTSGIMIIAKNDAAHLSLSTQIAQRKVIKEYVALLEGNLKEDSGTVNQPVGRSPKDRKLMAIVKTGREAITDYQVLTRFNENCFVKFRIHTGRTHQIRVHAKYLSHPIVGDKSYGIKKQKFDLNGQLLHAYRLTVKHPTTGEEMTFIAPLPQYFIDVYNVLAKRSGLGVFSYEVFEKQVKNR